jgi:hypothetical protein
MQKLVMQAGRVYPRAKEPEYARTVLEKGGLNAQAASLFREASDLPRAAEALRELGETEAAACLLAGPYAWSESYAPGVAAPRKNSVSRYLFTTRPDLRVTRQPVEVIVSGRASG